MKLGRLEYTMTPWCQAKDEEKNNNTLELLMYLYLVLSLISIKVNNKEVDYIMYNIHSSCINA